MLTIISSSDRGKQDLSRVFSSAKWSGDKNACARSLSLTVLPDADIQLGDHVVFSNEEKVLLDGFVCEISESTGLGSVKTVEVRDRGLQLNKNEAVYKFTSATPAEIVKKVASDFGFKVGVLPDTGSFRLTRNFVDVALYKIIATAYSKASSATGKHYCIRFEGDSLCVRELKRSASTPLLRPGSNLISASATRSITDLVNRVIITDKNGAELSRKEDAQSQKDFGLRQAVIKDSDNAAAEAAKMLEDNASPAYKINVDGLGDVRFVSGETVAVQDKASGLWGIFAIDSDSHTWQSGIYQVSLTLTLKNIMETVDAGSDPK